jgi:hypothetical protein
LRIVIENPSRSVKISFFNFLEKKKASKQAIRPITYTRQAKAGKTKSLKLIETSVNNILKNATRTFSREIDGGALVFDF